jgi:hypothetical protein
MDNDDVRRFPRCGVFWRTWFATERLLGTLPMVVVTPIVGALFGTAWAVSHPSVEVVRHGLVVPARQSLWGVLFTALIAGGVGVLAMIFLVFVVVWVWYRLLGDRVWEGVYARTLTQSVGSLMLFDIRRKGSVPVDPMTLNPLGCFVKTPSGTTWPSTEGDLYSRTNPEGFTAHAPLTPEPGTYEARWYSTRGRSREYEVARVKVRVADDWSVTQRPHDADPNRSGGEWQRLRASAAEGTGKLGEDGQVDVDPDAVQSTDSEGE